MLRLNQHTCMFSSMRIYVYIYIHMYSMCMYVCMYVCVCMHVCIYVCMYVCMYVYIYIYIYHTYISTMFVSVAGPRASPCRGISPGSCHRDPSNGLDYLITSFVGRSNNHINKLHFRSHLKQRNMFEMGMGQSSKFSVSFFFFFLNEQ